MLYLACRWLHFVAVISWMAGVLYLYRILIYQAERGDSPESRDLLTLMGRKLYRIITRPAMVVAFLAGFGMISQRLDILQSGWFHVKFVCLLGIAGMSVHAGRLVGRFEQRTGKLPTSKQLRIYNEIPTLLMMILIGMAVFKPF